MMKTILHTFALIALLTVNVMAKRTAPEEVTPIRTEKAVFSVPHFPQGERKQNGGVVEARDPQTNALLWQVPIFTTEYNAALEKDVQDVFIKSLSLDKVHNLLILSDEKSRVFVLNLSTKKVTRID
jgi:hypothetical protein